MDPFDAQLLQHFEAYKLPGWERMQYKAFRAWTNHKLSVRKWKPAEYLEDVFEDGFTLITLLEILSGKDVVPAGQKTTKNPSMRIQKIGNNNFNFVFMKKEGIRLENIGSEDIVDKNRKLILGLIWTLILHYQLAFAKGDSGAGPKKELLELVRGLLKPFNLPVDNFDNNWQDGRAFCALIAQHDPTLLDMTKINPNNAKENLEKAFAILEKTKDIPRMLDPNDVIAQKPDEKAVITYLAMILPVLTPVEKMPANSTLVSSPADIAPFEAGKQEPTFAIRSCHARSTLFEAELVGPDGKLPVVIRDNADKTYAIVPQRPYVTPGVYTLSAYFNKAHITQSPIRFTVLGGGPVRESSAGALFLPSKAGPSVASTLVVFPLTDTFRVPESSPHFVIEPRNANNQPIRTGGHRDQFTSSLTGPETIPTQIADRPDGTYAVNLLKPLTVPGRYKLSVQCNGTDISGSPFFFTVVVAAPAPAPKAAGPSAPHSNLQASPVADSYTAPNGLPQFTTQLRDPSSGPISGAANALSAAITGPEPIPCSVSEAYPAGNYNVVLGKPVTLPGRYKLTVQCNGADVNGSPLYFNVVKAGPSAPHSNLQASPVAESYTAPNGLPQFTTQLRDPSSAPVSGAANALSAAITGPEPIPCSVSEAYPAGNYNVVLGKPVTLPGRYKLTVQCNGADVNGSPLYFNVAAAPKAGPSAPHSTLQVTPVAESYIAPSGLPQFVVLLRNPARDPCPGQAAALSAAITGPEPIACSASDAGNGSYVIVLAKPVTLPGRYKLEVLCNGEPVAQSPFYFVVVATPSPYTSEVSPVGGNAENTFVVPAAQPQFALQLRDLGKAPCDGTQGEPLSAQLIGPEAIAAAVLEARGGGVGAHHIVFAKPFTVAGRYQLDVYLGKAHVKGSPVFFNVVVQDDSRSLALAPRSAPTTGNLSELDELYLTLSSPVAAQQKAEEERRRQAEEERRAAAEADAKIAARKAEEARKAAEAQARAEEEERARARAALEELERTRARAQVEEEAAKARARAAAEEAERLRSKAAAEELELQRVRARAAEEEAARARARAVEEEAARARARAAAEEAERARQRAEEDAARARARAVAEEGERARQRAAEEEAAKARARSAPPPMQDELEALIGDLAGSNKKPLTSAAAAPPTSNADANVYTINVKFQQFQPQDASRALDDPMVFTVLLQHQPLVQSLKEQLNAVPAPSGRPADVSAVKRNVYEVESEEDPLRNAIQLVFRTRTLDVPMLLRLLVGVVRAAKVVIDAAPADKRGQGVRAVQLFVLAVLRFIVTVSNLRYATDADFQAAVNPVSKEVTDSYRDLLNWLRSLYSTNTPVAPIAAPASPVATSPSPRLPVVVVMTVRQTFDNVLSTLPNSQSALITYNWRELDDVFRLVANILRQLHPRVTSADQVKLKATIQPVLDIGKAMRAHQATGNWVAFRDDKTKFIVALHALRDFLLELERRYSLSIDALIGASGSLSARSPAPISPAAQDNTRSVVGIDIGEVRRTLRRVMDELNAAADSTADNADRTMLREAARSLEGADEPIADALMFNDIGRLRIAIATYEGKLEAMQVMLRAFEQREAIRRDKARIRCAVCHNIIEGQYLKVGDKGFHKDCFRCTDCRSPIGELFYTDSMGRYFCPNHPPRD